MAQVCTVVEKLAREQGIFGDEAIVCKADDCFFLHGEVEDTAHAHLDCPASSSSRAIGIDTGRHDANVPWTDRTLQWGNASNIAECNVAESSQRIDSCSSSPSWGEKSVQLR